MTKIQRSSLAAIAILGLSHSAICAAGGPAKAGKELSKSILICARDLIDGKRAGADGVKLAGGFLSDARDNASNPEALARIDGQCAAALKGSPKVSITREQQLEAAKTLGGSCGTKLMLEDFIAPKLVCHKAGIAVSAAAWFGLGAKIDGSKCDSSDGRRWLALSLGIAIGGGEGLEADLNFGRLSTGKRETYSKNPLSASSPLAFARGFLFERKGEDMNDGIDDKPWNEPVKGAGIGLGFTVMKFGQVELEVLPLGTNRDTLYGQFMRDEASSCRELAKPEPAPQNVAATTQAAAPRDDSSRDQPKGVSVPAAGSPAERAACATQTQQPAL